MSMPEKPSIEHGFGSQKIAEAREIREEEETTEMERRIIEPQPKLRHILRTLDLLHSPEQEGGAKKHWTELYKEVPPYENALELSDNVRETVRTYIAEKIPKLKERVPSIADLKDKPMLEALVDNWFESIREVEGQRREVLMAMMAHVVNRIESTAYRNILKSASENDLHKLGIDRASRDLTVALLKASEAADPLFIRFLAYTQLSGEPPEEAGPVKLFLDNDPNPHTFAELFPHETSYLERNLQRIAETSHAWEDKPGGGIFKQYVETLSRFYATKNTQTAEEHFDTLQKQYAELVTSDFPILVTPPTEGYYKEPYIDPEMRISIATKDSMEEEESFRRVQASMTESLGILGLERFEEDTRQQPLRSVTTLGSFGVNLVFKAVAQEKPAIVLYRNEQIHQYDREFPEFLEEMVSNTDAVFAGLPLEERKELMERMSRLNTIMHEFGHASLPDDSSEAKRLGRKPLTKIDEVKADIVYRPLIPSMIEKGVLEGTKDQWAVASLGSALQDLRSHPAGDPYYHTAVYSLNDCLEREVVRFENDKLTITDTEAYYEVLKNAALELIQLYENPSTTETKATHWIRERCQPNEKLAQVETFLKEQAAST